jgi:hypothetical protein
MMPLRTSCRERPAAGLAVVLLLLLVMVGSVSAVALQPPLHSSAWVQQTLLNLLVGVVGLDASLSRTGQLQLPFKNRQLWKWTAESIDPFVRLRITADCTQ